MGVQQGAVIRLPGRSERPVTVRQFDDLRGRCCTLTLAANTNRLLLDCLVVWPTRRQHHGDGENAEAVQDLAIVQIGLDNRCCRGQVDDCR